MNTIDNLTKNEAIQAMRNGNKVRHKYFAYDEWVTLTKSGRYLFEDGIEVDHDLFWLDRTSNEWETGWSIILENTAYEQEQSIGHTPESEMQEQSKTEGKTITPDILYDEIKTVLTKSLFEDGYTVTDAALSISETFEYYASQEVSKLTTPLIKQIEEKDKRIKELEKVILVKNETIDEFIDVLKELCDLKEYKDNVGKDTEYNKRQPIAWKQANELLNRLIGYGEPSNDEDWSGGFADNH